MGGRAGLNGRGKSLFHRIALSESLSLPAIYIFCMLLVCLGYNYSKTYSTYYEHHNTAVKITSYELLNEKLLPHSTLKKQKTRTRNRSTSLGAHMQSESK